MTKIVIFFLNVSPPPILKSWSPYVAASIPEIAYIPFLVIIFPET